jgi:mersacidin/lichenicidin family type 2 lantibiotic
MSGLDIIRAWKDEDYRRSLSAEEHAQLPQHPAGLIELTDADLDNVIGAQATTLDSDCREKKGRIAPTLGVCFTVPPDCDPGNPRYTIFICQ